ncbi:MAG: type I DNA topoisomerase [Thermodesulfobacterium geofontis]|uniref:DNA topoisomerase n=2 Tax=Thermodesulfobacterium geofontis TaxID=1295609 RepID=A0A2N7PM69_9BACT|nr:MAG: type I DNA topoisomerase [Thermodesulfobacterium geofontis]
MILFVVESPTKIKTLQKFLKEGFIFRATFGHIRDLPKVKLGIDLNTFKPTLEWLSNKRKVLSEIKKIGSQVKEVYLATDPDREGEAIAYHFYEYLSKIKPELKFKRLDLIEITENGLKKALSNLREINPYLYQSWLTRRVLDRLIGYLISPQLSKNFKKSLSAGRVQSVALRLIVEREREIENFVPEKSYSLEIKLKKDYTEISAGLYYKNKLYKTKNKEKLIKFFKEKLSKDFITLEKIEERIEKKNPPLPLKTTTLIEISQKFLGYEPKQTMYYAQRLYENGYITYMRTDSVRVSEYAKKLAKEFIELYFGRKFVAQKINIKKNRFVQDAHECIRPTDIYREDVPLSEPEKKLYKLIRSFFIASQMVPAEYLLRTYIFTHKNLEKDYIFKSTYRKLIFEGFLKIFRNQEEENEFVDLRIKETFEVSEWRIKEHITEPPSRYTSSTLIKKLESMGIGRPSTYATLLDIIKENM